MNTVALLSLTDHNFQDLLQALIRCPPDLPDVRLKDVRPTSIVVWSASFSE
ncbi:MAG: hypothetical protein Q8M16_13430 [Pirellulaceae bacterium]|nr:hypothetical protein [Pirellulaceae bacterium]